MKKFYPFFPLSSSKGVATRVSGKKRNYEQELKIMVKSKMICHAKRCKPVGTTIWKYHLGSSKIALYIAPINMLSFQNNHFGINIGNPELA